MEKPYSEMTMWEQMAYDAKHGIPLEPWQIAEREQEKRREEVERDECFIDEHLVGHLRELPTWAQTYIKYLRGANEGK